jgi:trigger factor
MNITREDTGELTATITLEIEKADYEEKVTKTLKDQQRRASMPGFRPGKVPFGMIKKMYGKAVLAEEVNQILSEKMTSYILDNKLNVIGNPLPNQEKQEDINFDEWGNYRFYFDIGFAPEFDFTLDDNLKIDYYKIKADDKMVDEQIKNYRTRMGSHSHPEKVGEDDVVQGELVELDENGEVKDGGINRKTAISVNTIKDKEIKNRFVGAGQEDVITFNPLKATENKTETAYLLGQKAEEIGDNTPDFNFTITEITRQELAEMDTDFFKKAFGEDCDTEKKFREKVAESIETQFVPESDRLFMNHLIEKLVKEVDISLPEDFLKRLIAETNKEGLSEKEIEDKFDDYLKSFKWQLIESKIAKEKDLKVEEEEIRNMV